MLTSFVDELVSELVAAVVVFVVFVVLAVFEVDSSMEGASSPLFDDCTLLLLLVLVNRSRSSGVRIVAFLSSALLPIASPPFTPPLTPLLISPLMPPVMPLVMPPVTSLLVL